MCTAGFAREHAPIVERALEPLRAGGRERVLLERPQVPRERAHALVAHGIALVRHRRRPDLAGLERFLDLLEVRE